MLKLGRSSAPQLFSLLFNLRLTTSSFFHSFNALTLSDYPKEVRRKDRQENDPEFLKTVLLTSVSCSIAIQSEGYPLNHVAFFTYDEPSHEIIFHFSKHGFASKEITDGKKVCVSVYKYGKLYTAKRAVDFGCEYQSVIIYGTIKVLQEEDARMDAMKMFFQKFFSNVSDDGYDPFTPNDAKPIHVARIRIDQWFGKEHLVPDLAISSFYSPLKPVI
jgi:nitroimidazol reductase NimA-like FMN-containing flavoprotein (pyridoxamine 5'-phosphate oxidase superfamily)